MGDNKGYYVAPVNTSLSFSSPVEGESLFGPALEFLQTIYPGAYSQDDTSKATLYSPEAMNCPHEGRESGALTHPGATGYDLFPGRGDPSPIRSTETQGTHLYLLAITHQPFLFGKYPGHDCKRSSGR